MFLSFLTQPHRPFCDVSMELLGWTGSGVDLWPVQTRAGSAQTYPTHPAVWPLLPGSIAVLARPLTYKVKAWDTPKQDLNTIQNFSFILSHLLTISGLVFLHLFNCVDLANFFNPLTDFLLT